MIKLGIDPRGIIASGKATSEVWQEKHWDQEQAKAGKLSNYVDVTFDKIVDQDKVLPIQKLIEKGLGKEKIYWYPRASGYPVPMQ